MGSSLSGRTYYLTDGSQPVVEMDSTGTAVKAVNTFGANGLLSRNVPGGTNAFYTFDPQGSVCQRFDRTANLLSSDEYDAYGALLGTTQTGGRDVFGHGAQWGYTTDPETGLLLLTNQYYDPGTARFLTCRFSAEWAARVGSIALRLSATGARGRQRGVTGHEERAMGEAARRRVVGEWLEQDGKVVGNQEYRIINHLIRDHFVRVGSRDGGWTGLFRDPTSGELWELTYPHGGWHGGGPPTLTELSEAEARELYGDLPL